MKKRILFLNPHYSTGGSCAYINKIAEHFKDKFDISICEKSFFGDAYVVHRNKAKEDFDFHSLYGKDEDLIPLINKLKPSIIHIHEVPESFLKPEVLSKLYSNDRHYSIVVTSHSSLTRKKDFTYIPDKIIAVNKWQADLFYREFEGENITIGMWEYPIEDKKVCWEEKQAAKTRLGMDNKIQCLMPGLFTKGKNQEEIFKIASFFPNITFNFIGNQAENFADYWKPLMENKPDNCVVWGERNDIEEFYLASDFVYFSSIYELWPLVIRESLSYKLPVFLRRLPTYLSEYDNNKLIHYINNDIEQTKKLLNEYCGNL